MNAGQGRGGTVTAEKTVEKEHKGKDKARRNIMETNERNQEEIRAKARGKLEAELKAEKNRIYAEPIILHMIKRCEEDAGLAEDVLQAQKTFKKCFNHICGEAQKQADSSRVAYVIDSVVYEWAEDYYRMDDKAAGEKKKAKEEKGRKGAKGKAESREGAPKPDVKEQAEESAEAQKTGEEKPEAENVETPELVKRQPEEDSPEASAPTEKEPEENSETPKPAGKKQTAKARKTAEPAQEKAGKATESPEQEAGKQGKVKQKKPNSGREMDGQMDLFPLLGMQEAEDAE